MKSEKMRIRKLSRPILGFSLMLLLVAAVFLLAGDFQAFLDLQKRPKNASDEANEVPTSYEEKPSSSCDLFSGKWVFDNVSAPYYEEGKCSFMMPEFACEENGRKDFKFRNWRWQPHHCDLPRFNGTAFFEKMRGKKLIFVGDSLNRNQWTSMLCLLESALSPSSNKTVVRSESMFSFVSNEYNATIGYYWSPLLVESNGDDPLSHHLARLVVRLNGIDKNARHWNDADILIFDSYTWWFKPFFTVVFGNSLESSDAINKTVENMDFRLYEMALDEWSNWLEININRTKTSMFFMSGSPIHHLGIRGEQRNCYNETEPIFEDKLIGLVSSGERMRAAELAVEKLKSRGVKIDYLNTTHLSEYRKDAHPSIYRSSHNISEVQSADPVSYSDCIHWCLPGVPDTWNHILFSYIINL